METNVLTLIIIFAITFLVRIFTVTVGGGGIILLPMLIFFGLPPSMAVATNRLGAFSHNISLIKFHQHRQVKWKLGWYLLIPGLIGTIIGTYFVISIDQGLFQRLISIIIVLSVVLLLIKNKLGTKEFKPSKNRLITGWFLSLLASFMGGLFALTGLWYNFVYLFLGLTYLQTAATRKISGMITAIVSLSMLVYAGLINWEIATVMFLASGIGSWIGAILGIKMGSEWIRRLFIIVAFISAIKLFFS